MSKTLHFKITLNESNPPIWRIFKVEDSYRLDRFHQVIQIVMGWWNSHLHEFVIRDRTIGMPIEEFYDMPPVEDETKYRLKQFHFKEGDTFNYLYDFGDDWHHTIQVLKVEESDLDMPVCVYGDRACPPEDCGGIGGYENLVEIISDPTHSEYESWTTWLPDNYDPKVFPLEEVNEELAKFGAWHKKHPRKRSTPWHQV